MSDLPEIRPSGHLQMGSARKRPGIPGHNNCNVDWTTVSLIEAQLVGVDTEIPGTEADNYGHPARPPIPANVPLSFENAARAIGMRPKRARALQSTPAYQSALDAAVAGAKAESW